MGTHGGQLWLCKYHSQHALPSLAQRWQAARKPLKALLVIDNKRTCQALRVGRYDDTTTRWAKDGHCLHRFALNPGLPCGLRPGHPTCIHCSLQLRPARLRVRCPHPRDGLTSTCDSTSLARSSASVNWLCQLNSWPYACWTAFASIPPNMLQGQKEPASTSLRSSWLNPNLGKK